MTQEQIEAAVKKFDELPDSAQVRMPVVVAITGFASSTVWRHVKDGKLPAPKRWGGNSITFTVGELRAALKAKAA